MCAAKRFTAFHCDSALTCPPVDLSGFNPLILSLPECVFRANSPVLDTLARMAASHDVSDALLLFSLVADQLRRDLKDDTLSAQEKSGDWLRAFNVIGDQRRVVEECQTKVGELVRSLQDLCARHRGLDVKNWYDDIDQMKHANLEKELSTKKEEVVARQAALARLDERKDILEKYAQFVRWEVLLKRGHKPVTRIKFSKQDIAGRRIWLFVSNTGIEKKVKSKDEKGRSMDINVYHGRRLEVAMTNMVRRTEHSLEKRHATAARQSSSSKSAAVMQAEAQNASTDAARELLSTKQVGESLATSGANAMGLEKPREEIHAAEQRLCTSRGITDLCMRIMSKTSKMGVMYTVNALDEALGQGKGGERVPWATWPQQIGADIQYPQGLVDLHVVFSFKNSCEALGQDVLCGEQSDESEYVERSADGRFVRWKAADSGIHRYTSWYVYNFGADVIRGKSGVTPVMPDYNPDFPVADAEIASELGSLQDMPDQVICAHAEAWLKRFGYQPEAILCEKARWAVTLSLSRSCRPADLSEGCHRDFHSLCMMAFRHLMYKLMSGGRDFTIEVDTTAILDSIAAANREEAKKVSICLASLRLSRRRLVIEWDGKKLNSEEVFKIDREMFLKRDVAENSYVDRFMPVWQRAGNLIPDHLLMINEMHVYLAENNGTFCLPTTAEAYEDLSFDGNFMANFFAFPQKAQRVYGNLQWRVVLGYIVLLTVYLGGGIAPMLGNIMYVGPMATGKTAILKLLMAMLIAGSYVEQLYTSEKGNMVSGVRETMLIRDEFDSALLSNDPKHARQLQFEKNRMTGDGGQGFTRLESRNGKLEQVQGKGRFAYSQAAGSNMLDMKDTADPAFVSRFILVDVPADSRQQVAVMLNQTNATSSAASSAGSGTGTSSEVKQEIYDSSHIKRFKRTQLVFALACYMIRAGVVEVPDHSILADAYRSMVAYGNTQCGMKIPFQRAWPKIYILSMVLCIYLKIVWYFDSPRSPYYDTPAIRECLAKPPPPGSDKPVIPPELLPKFDPRDLLKLRFIVTVEQALIILQLLTSEFEPEATRDVSTKLFSYFYDPRRKECFENEEGIHYNPTLCSSELAMATMSTVPPSQARSARFQQQIVTAEASVTKGKTTTAIKRTHGVMTMEDTVVDPVAHVGATLNTQQPQPRSVSAVPPHQRVAAAAEPEEDTATDISEGWTDPDWYALRVYRHSEFKQQQWTNLYTADPALLDEAFQFNKRRSSETAVELYHSGEGSRSFRLLMLRVHGMLRGVGDPINPNSNTAEPTHTDLMETARVLGNWRTKFITTADKQRVASLRPSPENEYIWLFHRSLVASRPDSGVHECIRHYLCVNYARNKQACGKYVPKEATPTVFSATAGRIVPYYGKVFVLDHFPLKPRCLSEVSNLNAQDRPELNASRGLRTDAGMTEPWDYDGDLIYADLPMDTIARWRYAAQRCISSDVMDRYAPDPSLEFVARRRFWDKYPVCRPPGRYPRKLATEMLNLAKHAEFCEPLLQDHDVKLLLESYEAGDETNVEALIEEDRARARMLIVQKIFHAVIFVASEKQKIVKKTLVIADQKAAKRREYDDDDPPSLYNLAAVPGPVSTELVPIKKQTPQQRHNRAIEEQFNQLIESKAGWYFFDSWTQKKMTGQQLVEAVFLHRGHSDKTHDCYYDLDRWIRHAASTSGIREMADPIQDMLSRTSLFPTTPDGAHICVDWDNKEGKRAEKEAHAKECEEKLCEMRVSVSCDPVSQLEDIEAAAKLNELEIPLLQLRPAVQFALHRLGELKIPVDAKSDPVAMLKAYKEKKDQLEAQARIQTLLGEFELPPPAAASVAAAMVAEVKEAQSKARVDKAEQLWLNDTTLALMAPSVGSSSSSSSTSVVTNYNSLREAIEQLERKSTTAKERAEQRRRDKENEQREKDMLRCAASKTFVVDIPGFTYQDRQDARKYSYSLHTWHKHSNVKDASVYLANLSNWDLIECPRHSLFSASS